jgi:aflatoxin B1 aldehyde reductase
MNMGYAGKSGVRMSDRHECQEILDTFFKYGNELDTARAYGDGTTEQVRNISVMF